MKKTVCSILAAVLLLGCLSGCGGNEPANSEGKETLRLAVAEDPATLNPMQKTNTAGEYVADAVFESLVFYDNYGEIEYQLAKALDISEDGKTYTFQLRDDVKFSDGTPFTSKDVVFTFDVAKDEPYVAPRLQGIASYEAADDNTFVIHMEYPFAALLTNLNYIFILPDNYLGQDAESFFDNPVGTGKYTFTSWEKNSKITLTRNDAYYGGPGAFKSLEILTIPDTFSRSIQIQSGDVDHGEIDTTSIDEIRANDQLQVIEGPVIRFGMITLNMTQPPFDDVCVRQAINYAVNRDGILAMCNDGIGKATSIVFHSSVLGYTEDVTQYDYDVEKAKALLAEAGITTPYDLGKILCTSTSSAIAEAVQQALQKIGFTVEIEQQESSAFYSNLCNYNYTIAAARMGTDGDAELVAEQFFYDDASLNIAGYNNDEVQAQLRAASEEDDTVKRLELYKVALEGLQQDAPFVMLYEFPAVVGASKNLTYDGFYSGGNLRVTKLGWIAE